MSEKVKKGIIWLIAIIVIIGIIIFGKNKIGKRANKNIKVEENYKPSVKVGKDIYTLTKDVEINLKELEPMGEIVKSYNTLSKNIDDSDDHLTSNIYKEGSYVYKYNESEIIVKEDEKTYLLTKTSIDKSNNETDPLLRKTLWGQRKEEIKEIEDKQYSKMYREEDNFLMYEDVSVLNEEYLLTYLFNDDKLIGILYELDVLPNNRGELAEKHQEVTDLLNKNYQKEDYEVESKDIWANKEREYSSSIWNKGIIDGELEMENKWSLSDYNIFLKTSKQSDFDFLFTKSNEILDANLYILLTPEDSIEKLMEIKPKLTKEQSSIKEGKIDIFEDSIHEDNINKLVADKESDIGIIRFNKAKQYIVLTNNTESPINLTGWYITTQNKNNTFYFEDGFIIKPQEHILIYAADGKTHYNKGISRDFQWSPLPVFNEIQDGITLYNNDNIEITKAK